MPNGKVVQIRLRKQDKKLLDACEALNPQKVKAALKEGADINVRDPKYHLTPIDIVAGFAREAKFSQCFHVLVVEILTELLEHGACPDGASGCCSQPGQESPWVCFSKYSPDGMCCKLLQQAGARSCMADNPAK